MSETQHGPVVTDAAGPDAETGEADDVSEYSEEATGLDPAGEAADAASADGVSEDADLEAIKRAYRRLARDLHPDLQPDADATRRRALERRFAEVTAAYEALL